MREQWLDFRNIDTIELAICECEDKIVWFINLFLFNEILKDNDGLSEEIVLSYDHIKGLKKGIIPYCKICGRLIDITFSPSIYVGRKELD